MPYCYDYYIDGNLRVHTDPILCEPEHRDICCVYCIDCDVCRDICDNVEYCESCPCYVEED